MQRHAVKSGAIVAIGHDGTDLEVEFVSGRVYRYAGVSPKDLEALLGATSIGKHFGEHIRGKFDHALVPPPEPTTED